MKGVYMMLTKRDIVGIVDKSRKSTINDDLIANINSILLAEDEDEVRVDIVDKFLTYGGVLVSGKYSIEQYLSAVKFVTYKIMGMNNIDAYTRTHPDRYKKHIKKYMDLGSSEEEARSKIGTIVTGLANGKLVTSILNQIQLPTKILNFGRLQEAINVEVDLMYNSRSDMVKHNAAKTLIEYLGDDKDKMEIPISIQKQGEIIDQYESIFSRLAEEKLELMKNGSDVKEITNATIVEVIEDE